MPEPEPPATPNREKVPVQSQPLWKGSCSPFPGLQHPASFSGLQGDPGGDRERAITDGIWPSLVESLAETSAPEHSEIVGSKRWETSQQWRCHMFCPPLQRPQESSPRAALSQPGSQGHTGWRLGSELRLWIFPHSIHICSGLWCEHHQRG